VARSKKPKLGDLVRVDWVDSVLETTWKTMELLCDSTSVCESTGWLIRDEDEFVTVAGHKDAQCENYHGVVTIPRCAIKRIRKIEEAT